MDDDRQGDTGCQLELLFEGDQLAVAWRVLAVEVEADFTDGDDSGVPGQLFESGDLVVGQRMGVVGVNSGGGEDFGSGTAGRMAFGDFDRVPARFDIGTGADDAVDPGGGGAGNDVVAIGVELLEGEVGVGIYDSGGGGQLLPPAAPSVAPR